MRTRITTVEELQSIFAETLFNYTDKVSKISPNSVLAGISYGVAKVAQKAIKDIALVETNLFPDDAVGDQLDYIASIRGVSPRFAALGSSTYVRLVAQPGTVYVAGVNLLRSTSGVNFTFENNVTIGDSGFGYAKISSVDAGERTNVEALTITTVNPAPVGHTAVINDFTATGGRDVEADNQFRNRVKTTGNLLAKGTLSYLEQVFLSINPNILRLFQLGFDAQGKVVIGVATQNGANLSGAELDDLISGASDFFSWTDLRQFASESVGVVVQNIEYFPIDIDFRAKLNTGVSPDDIRRSIQTAISRRLDFRNFVQGDRVEWEDILTIVSNTNGIVYVPDQFFYPRVDLQIPFSQLPRVRDFVMRDIDGNVITDVQGNLSPVFFPATQDEVFKSTVILI